MVSWVTLHVLFLFLNFLVLLVAGLALAFGVFLRQRMTSFACSTAPPVEISKRMFVHLISGLVLFTKGCAIV